MLPRHLLSAAAAFWGVIGTALLFLPMEAGALLGLTAGSELPLQLVAGGCLAVAILDWAGRGAIYGGIYGRPIVLANLAFGAVVGGSLVSALLDGRIGGAWWLLGAPAVLHAAAFGWLIRRPPWAEDRAGESKGG